MAILLNERITIVDAPHLIISIITFTEEELEEEEELEAEDAGEEVEEEVFVSESLLLSLLLLLTTAAVNCLCMSYDCKHETPECS